MSPLSERFEMRLDQETLDGIDRWRAAQSGLPSRAEAIRRLVETGLSATTQPPVNLSGGEKLILLMLGELYEHLGIRGDINPEFNAQAIYGGHYWGFRWKYNGILHDHEDKPETVAEVVDILDMWLFLESGYRGLGPEDRALVDQEIAPRTSVTFPGFDGHDESGHLGVATFLLEQLDRFGSFKGRDLDSHSPKLGTYRRMLAIFTPLRPSLGDRQLSASDLLSVLFERAHPTRRKQRVPPNAPV